MALLLCLSIIHFFQQRTILPRHVINLSKHDSTAFVEPLAPSTIGQIGKSLLDTKVIKVIHETLTNKTANQTEGPKVEAEVPVVIKPIKKPDPIPEPVVVEPEIIEEEEKKEEEPEVIEEPVVEPPVPVVDPIDEAASYYLSTLTELSSMMLEQSLHHFQPTAHEKVARIFDLSYLPPRDRLKQELISIAWLHNMFNNFNKKHSHKLSPAPPKI